MGIRKNYRSLTDDERERFIQALYHVKSTGLVDQFADVHIRHFNHLIHRSSHFLPWHREFILRFERALQEHDPSVTIPYWDSTVDRSPSNPLWADSFLGQFDSAWGLGRVFGGVTLPTAAQVEANQRRATYLAFWPELERAIHNPPHIWVGGIMGGAASPGDPVFFLHHCWIDMLWARWQIAHPGVLFEADQPGAGLNDPLMEWPDRSPADVLDHHALNYTYDIETLPISGQLLSYGDAGTPGNVSDRIIVGFGGWLDFKFLFSGRNLAGENHIYAVDQNGQLLSYVDTGTPGNVSDPVVVGFGGWLDFKFLFSGVNLAGENRIYAVDQNGQLLSYVDTGTPGNVSDPMVVGFGGWLDFKFLFSGRNLASENRIYAVDQDGQLLSYVDTGTPGNVSDPVVAGFGGWLDFKFLFSGVNLAGENRIYAVDQNGQLLSYVDTGTPGNVSDPVVVGFGGWLDFKFLFSGMNLAGENRIYAVVA